MLIFVRLKDGVIAAPAVGDEIDLDIIETVDQTPRTYKHVKITSSTIKDNGAFSFDGEFRMSGCHSDMWYIHMDAYGNGNSDGRVRD